MRDVSSHGASNALSVASDIIVNYDGQCPEEACRWRLQTFSATDWTTFWLDPPASRRCCARIIPCARCECSFEQIGALMMYLSIRSADPELEGPAYAVVHRLLGQLDTIAHCVRIFVALRSRVRTSNILEDLCVP